MWIYFAVTIVLTVTVVAGALSPKLVLLMGRKLSANTSGGKDESFAGTEDEGDPTDHVSRKPSSQSFVVRLLRRCTPTLPKEEKEKADVEIDDV